MIRDVKQTDKEAFLSMAEAFYTSPAVEHRVKREHFHTTFETAMRENPYLRVVILESTGETAGYAILSFTYSNEAGGMVVWIEEVYIKDAYRGKGLGSELLAFAESEYRTVKRFRLEATKFNTGAISLYQKQGYRVLDYVQLVKDRDQSGDDGSSSLA